MGASDVSRPERLGALLAAPVALLPRPLRAALLYSALTVALTWPLAARLRVMDAGDSAFFAWEIGWERHSLLTDPGRLPHANMFHPLPYALGLDEPTRGHPRSG